MAKEPNNFTTVYDLDYFSGSQMFLYIGDVWIDEVTSLQYVTRQEKQPIYGYASQLYDDVAAGRVIVQGSFTINYKEQGYLWAVLRRWKDITENIALPGLNLTTKRDIARQENRDRALLANRLGGGSGRPVVGSNGTRISRASIERLVRGEATTQERNDFYNQLAGYATFDVDSPRDKTFEDIAEIFEDQIWTQPDNNNLNNQIRRTDDNRFDGFDMYVVFGNYANPKANHTVQKIIGVNLLTQGKSVMINGMPIQEEYSFFARTVA